MRATFGFLFFGATLAACASGELEEYKVRPTRPERFSDAGTAATPEPEVPTTPLNADASASPASVDASMQPVVDASTPSQADASTPRGMDAAAPPPPPPPPPPPSLGDGAPVSAPIVSGLSISEIAVYQGVKIPIARAGAIVAERKAPVVQNREALIRVFVSRDARYTGQSVTATLYRTAGGVAMPAITDTKSIRATSSDADLVSTFNFTVPTGGLPADVSYSVLITDPAATPTSASSAGRYPNAGGQESLNVQSTGDKLKVVIVPIQLTAMGGRTADNSSAQLEHYRKLFYAVYPAVKIDISFRSVYASDQRVSGGQDSVAFTNLLREMVSLHSADGAARDVYYYGAFTSTDSFRTYCGLQCTTGLCGLDSQGTSTHRACTGIGFTNASAQTAVHEIGHAFGRSHVGTTGTEAGVDPAYPYANGSVGSWGYDIVNKTFFSPSNFTDFMGYGQRTWTSDYTYNALFKRMKLVNKPFLPEKSQITGTQTFDWYNVSATGDVTYSGPVLVGGAPDGEPVSLSFLASDDTDLQSVSGGYTSYDHIPGGYLIVPRAPAGAVTARLHGLPGASGTRDFAVQTNRQ
jgi:hypothetical protein